jgi:oligosaccharide repeat unit polymerase
MNSYWLILVPLVAYLLILAKEVLKTKRLFTFYSLLLMLYCFSLGTNIASGLFTDYQFNAATMVYFTVTIYLFIYPFKYLRLDLRPVFIDPPWGRFRVVSIVVIALSLICLVASFPSALAAVTTKDINELRHSISVESMNIEGLVRTRPRSLDLLAHFSSSLYFISLTLFFVALVRRYNRILVVLLLVGSFSKVLEMLTRAGRTGLVIWGFFFLANYLYFRRYMTSAMTSAVRTIALVALAVTAMLFLAVSQNRFSESLYYSAGGKEVFGTAAAILDYVGQPVVVFDRFVESGFSPYFSGAYMFPLVNRTLGLFGLPSRSLDEMYAHIWASIPDTAFSFAPFIRELWYDVGPVGVPVLGVLFNVLVIRLCRTLNRSVQVRPALLLFAMYSVPFVGIISYPLGSMNDNFGLLAALLVPF